MDECLSAEIDWLGQTEDQSVGYVIEASIHYPMELHEAPNDDPPTAERHDVKVTMLTNNQLELRT